MDIGMVIYDGYYDDDSGVLILGETHPVARKEHRCTLCKGTIKVGQRYKRYRGIDDYSGPFVQKECPACIATQDYDRYGMSEN